MNLDSINKVYFLGIGGIGMSALARYFISKNCAVSGYDKTPSSLTKALEKEGAYISFEDNPKPLKEIILDPKHTLFIYTPAIPKNNKIKNYLINNGIKLYKRSEILGELSKNYKTIGIAGTHGKTTVSSMTAHILNTSKLGCHAFLGGITNNYQSNLITHPTSQWMVAEADEFDRSFLKLFPQIAVVTAMDADHLDIYGDALQLIEAFKDYAAQVKETGFLVTKLKLISHFPKSQNISTYDIKDSDADFYASDIELINHQYYFSIHYPNGKIEGISLPMPGLVNLENAVAATAAAKLAGADDESIRKALISFLGIKRRMELVLKNEHITFYDDYAHHPEEIKAAILSVKALFSNKKLTVVFQPHLYSRTHDFAEGFAESLDLADEIILLDIYPAREEPMEGVTSQLILDLIKNQNKTIISKNELVDFLKKGKPELLLTLGAGDIDRLVEPIKIAFYD